MKYPKKQTNTLSHLLRCEKISLDRAISSGLIPDIILHRFAHQCAARIFLREKAAGRDPHFLAWNALGAKFNWTENFCDPESSDDLWMARAIAEDVVDDAIYDDNLPEYLSDTAELAARVAVSDPVRAASGASVFAQTLSSEVDLGAYLDGTLDLETLDVTEEDPGVARERKWQINLLADMIESYEKGGVGVV